jgi:hypothetical protein
MRYSRCSAIQATISGLSPRRSSTTETGLAGILGFAFGDARDAHSDLSMAMKPSKREKTTKEGYVYSSDALLQKIRNIRQGGNFRFAGRRETTDATDKELAAFLYKVNFLTARKELADGTILRRFFEESRYLSSILVDFGFDWEVHPAYRWALQPDSIETIFAQLKLTSDDER